MINIERSHADLLEERLALLLPTVPAPLVDSVNLLIGQLRAGACDELLLNTVLMFLKKRLSASEDDAPKTERGSISPEEKGDAEVKEDEQRRITELIVDITELLNFRSNGMNYYIRSQL